jgi:site-specific DNA-methyltransferase (adenine-specific)
VTPYYSDDAVTLYHGDCREVLPSLGPVDHVMTDPPYSEYVHSKSRAGTRKIGGSASGGSLTAPSNFSRSVDFGFDALTNGMRDAVSAYVTAQCRRWALVFSDVESTGLWRECLTRGGLDYVRTGAWVKVGCTP